jgi:hypothetical protein
VPDTTENASKILDTITYSTTRSTEKLPIVKQSITNLQAALFTTQQPEESVLTEESTHRSSILRETLENEPTESLAETVSIRPLLSLAETGTKNPEISSLIATASDQALSANIGQAEPYLVIILPLLCLSLALCLILGLYSGCRTKTEKRKKQQRVGSRQVSINIIRMLLLYFISVFTGSVL